MGEETMTPASSVRRSIGAPGTSAKVAFPLSTIRQPLRPTPNLQLLPTRPIKQPTPLHILVADAVRIWNEPSTEFVRQDDEERAFEKQRGVSEEMNIRNCSDISSMASSRWPVDCLPHQRWIEKRYANFLADCHVSDGLAKWLITLFLFLCRTNKRTGCKWQKGEGDDESAKSEMQKWAGGWGKMLDWLKRVFP